MTYKQVEFQIQIGECLEDALVDRYHFAQQQRNVLRQLSEEALEHANLVAYYVDVEQEQPYEHFWQAIVTLGKAWDAWTQDETDVEQQYMLDCIGLEFLRQGYEQLVSFAQKETEQWVVDMEFLGEQHSLEQLPQFMEAFSGCQVREEGGMLRPLKSVAMILPLSLEPVEAEAIHICARCSNLSCPMRR